MILVGGSDNNDYLFLTARNLKIMISDLPVGTHLRVRTSNNNNHSIVLAGKLIQQLQFMMLTGADLIPAY